MGLLGVAVPLSRESSDGFDDRIDRTMFSDQVNDSTPSRRWRITKLELIHTEMPVEAIWTPNPGAFGSNPNRCAVHNA